MLIRLAVFCVLALSVPSQPNKTGGDKHPVPYNQPPAPVTTYTYDPNCCTTQAPQKADEKPHGWYTPFERPDWWLVIVAAITGGVVGWQAWETRKAAISMALSTKAVVEAQRARLEIEWVMEGDPSTDGRRSGWAISTFIKNVGQTVAKVTEVHERIDHVSTRTILEYETTDPPPPVKKGIGEPHITFPDEVYQIGMIHDFEIYPDLLVQDRVSRQKLRVVWYGWVIYKDHVGAEHRHKFFYTFSPGNRKLLRLGPPGYNGEDY